MDQTTTQEGSGQPEQTVAVVIPSQEEKIQESKQASTELADLNQPEIVAEFEQLQRLVQDPIEDYGKRAILQAAWKYGFTLEELGSAFRTKGQGLKRAGGLIKFATEIWPKRRQNSHAPTPAPAAPCSVRTHSKEQIASSFRRDPAYQAQAGTFETETVSPERLQELQDEAQYSPSEIIRQLARQRLRELSVP